MNTILSFFIDMNTTQACKILFKNFKRVVGEILPTIFRGILFATPCMFPWHTV